MVAQPAVPEGAAQLIAEFEGLNQPGVWPGGNSGITLGYGYDLGHHTVEHLHAAWSMLPEAERARLALACGRRGVEAQALAPLLRDITITPAAALDVLERVSLPEYTAQTRATFGAGYDRLPAGARAALVSLVYNRGGSLRGARRREMRSIRVACDLLDLDSIDVPGAQNLIARELRSMKRLWDGKGLGGLVRRREREAVLVEDRA